MLYHGAASDCPYGYSANLPVGCQSGELGPLAKHIPVPAVVSREQGYHCLPLLDVMQNDGSELVAPAQAHSEKSKQDLTAYEQFKTPQMVTVTTLTPNRKEIGKAFKKDAKVSP